MSEKQKTYKNTVIIAGSSMLGVFLSIIKNKITAIFLDPKSMGQFGILNDFLSFVSGLGALGVSNSGVQAIARVEDTPEGRKEVGKIYSGFIYFYTIIATVLMLGVFIFASEISILITKDTSLKYYLQIACSFVVFKIWSLIQGALITGLQQIKLLAKNTIYQGIFHTVSAILLVYFLGVKSIPYLVLSLAFGSWVVSYLQSKSLIKSISPTYKQRMPFKKMLPFLILGLATTWSGLLEGAVNIISKSLIIKNFDGNGSKYLGYYQVAVGFTAQYIGFITSSIVSDYYPRLTAMIGKASKVDIAKFVNQQMSISMHLIMPLLLIMLIYSKVFIHLLFSKAFLPASDLMSYSVSGTFFIVVCWPIAFVFLAHRATKTYIFTELIGNSTLLIFNYLAILTNFFPNIGLAYVLHYVVYLVVISFIFIKKYGGFFTNANIKFFLLNACTIGLVIFLKYQFTDTKEYIIYIIGAFLVALFFYACRKEYIYMFKAVFKKR
jgi:PST family polysaccharide transporter